jgi:hypothetical protein
MMPDLWHYSPFFFSRRGKPIHFGSRLAIFLDRRIIVLKIDIKSALFESIYEGEIFLFFQHVIDGTIGNKQPSRE